MTTFILVPEAHTTGWVWQEVADHLRTSGAEAHPVTLTGTDLETHIQNLLDLLDRAAPPVVLVAQGYGIHPARGAADRRPDKIARIVHVNAAMPQHGETALRTLGDRLPAETDGHFAPPTAREWARWGSLAGLSDEDLARLAERAVPQPAATFTQPLHLSGAVAELPSTAVLCTANGAGIATLQGLLDLGDPQLRALAVPQVTFFELDAGHWPMLSAPAALAEILLQAAAGEGHRLRPSGEKPAHLRSFLLDVPEHPRERNGRIDLYLPDADGPRPAIVLVHGGPVPADARPTPRDWPAYVGYGNLIAERGAVGVTVDHRLHAITDYARAAEDITATIETIRADPRVDGDRITLWFFSGGGPLSALWLAAPPPWLRCVAATYPVLAPFANWGMTDSPFNPATAVRTAGKLPIVLTRVGLERPEIAATVEEFLTEAKHAEANVEVIDIPTAHHGFETLDHTEESREAVHHAIRSVLHHLNTDL